MEKNKNQEHGTEDGSAKMELTVAAKKGADEQIGSFAPPL